MFVCFEGIDGAGKTTQARMLYTRLQAENHPVELVADPGTTPIGTAIRQILLTTDTPLTGMAQMLLFSAARAELAEYIKTKLAAGVTIICDRWLLSTYIYQGEINGIDLDLIRAIFQGTSNVTPDLCVLLDLSPEDASQRTGPGRDRYERKSLEDRRRMRAAYARHAIDPLVAHRLCKINAAISPEDTHSEVYRAYKNAVRGQQSQPIA